jgi:hypothetical protein
MNDEMPCAILAVGHGEAIFSIRAREDQRGGLRVLAWQMMALSITLALPTLPRRALDARLLGCPTRRIDAVTQTAKFGVYLHCRT